MIIVLDPSAAIEIVLNKKKAKNLIPHLAAADWVIAPRLYVSEINNVFWKYYEFTQLSKEVCETAIEKSLDLVEELFNESDFYREAFALACLTRSSVYDMFYLTLARRNDAHLMTLDTKLMATAKKQSIKYFL